MANKEVSVVDSKRSEARQGSEQFRHMPLSSLLPQLSVVSELKKYREILEQRLSFLQSDDNLSTEEKNLLEISMLQQTLGWLEIQGDV